MTQAPLPEFREGTSPFNTLNSLVWGDVPAGNDDAQPGNFPISLWNGRGNNPDITEMNNVTIEVKDKNGQNGGVDVSYSEGGGINGLVAGKWIKVKSDGAGKGNYQTDDPTDDGETTYTEIGGQDGHQIGNIDWDQYRLIHILMDVPGDATPGLIEFQIRIKYTYI